MPQKLSLADIFVLSPALLAAFSVSAAAEFFGCHDRERQVLSSRIIVACPDGRPYMRHRYRHTHEFSARPARPSPLFARSLFSPEALLFERALIGARI